MADGDCQAVAPGFGNDSEVFIDQAAIQGGIGGSPCLGGIVSGIYGMHPFYR